MRIIYDSVLTMLTESYQNWSMLVETTAFQSWRVFIETQCILSTRRPVFVGITPVLTLLIAYTDACCNYRHDWW